MCSGLCVVLTVVFNDFFAGIYNAIKNFVSELINDGDPLNFYGNFWSVCYIVKI